MSGVSITIDTVNLRASLDKLHGRMGHLQPLFEGIGQAVVSETVERFRREEAPDGSKWKKSQRAERENGLTLVGRGAHLRSSINPHARPDGVAVGTNMIYAAIHQFGGRTRPHEIRPHKPSGALKFGKVFAKRVNHPGSLMPARPFLGVGEHERAAIESEILTHLDGIGA